MFVKDRKGRIRGVKLYKPSVFNENHRMICLQSSRVVANQIESARRVISKKIKKIGVYRVHIRPTTSVSAKPSEVRMGKGKGSIDHYISRVKAGQLLFSIGGSVSPIIANEVFLKASKKLPLKIKIICSKRTL
jgi:large subunit ribosomal protein L16